MKQTRPERYLELFDKLDLDNVEDRRIGFHMLRNYFSTVLTDVAEELGVGSSINQDSLDRQWKYIRSKFDTVPGQLPSDMQKLPFQIIQSRNSVTHNERYDPSEDINDLQEIRDQAPEWRNEVEELAEAYFHAWEELSPKEALMDLADENLQEVRSAEPRFDNFEQEYENIHDLAKMAEQDLEQEVDHNRERIEKELVAVVRTSQQLKKKLSELERHEMEYEDYIMNFEGEIEGV